MKIIFILLDEGAFSDVIDGIKLEFLSGARSLVFYLGECLHSNFSQEASIQFSFISFKLLQLHLVHSNAMELGLVLHMFYIKTKILRTQHFRTKHFGQKAFRLFFSYFGQSK